tara:strand:- start:161 stop:415 length:255 start_codon:yes stop_codon:yes gene_type:complete
MTRQHFQFIADAMQRLPHDAELDRYDIIDLFAHELKRTNSAFNVERFRDACDVERTTRSTGDANFEAQRLDDKYDGVPADTGSL